MKKSLPYILLIAAFVAEARISILGAGLNLTVLFVYWTGLRYGPTRGTLAGALVGAIADSVAGGMLGPMMLSKATAGFLASFFRGGLFMWSPVLGVIAVFLLTGLDGFVSFALNAIYQQPAGAFGEAARQIFLQSALNIWAGLLLRPEDEDN